MASNTTKEQVLEQGRLLQDQESVQVPHRNCSASFGSDHKPRLWIHKDGLYVAYHCKHCGERGRYYQGHTRKPFIKETTKEISSSPGGGERDRRGTVKTHRIPSDASSNIQTWPREARIWVLRYITEQEVQKYGIQYSDIVHRVVLPVFKDTGLAGFQTRRIFDWDKGPKYLTYRNDPLFWYQCGDPHSPVVMVVEDVLSAIKCGTITHSVALLGVGMTDALVLYLSKFKKVLLMLDNDNAEVKRTQQKLKKRLEQFTEVQIIRLQKDPKEHTTQELRGLKEFV